jgi:outer membrane lipoprotein-sorting protein
MMQCKRIVAGLALLVLVGVPIVAQEDGGGEGSRSAEALEILEKVDAAVKAISSVRYKVKTEPGGVATQMVGPGEGKATLAGWNGRIPERFLVEVDSESRGQEVSVTAGGNGDMYFLVDHTAKKAYEDMDPAVLGSSAQLLFGFAMVEYVHERPFDDELNAETVELLGSETVGGEDCHEIRVVYAGGRGESIWYFSKKDYTPRGRVQVFNTPQGEGSVKRMLYDVEIDPETEDAMFVMKLPEGYEQIDDFAP